MSYTQFFYFPFVPFCRAIKWCEMKLIALHLLLPDWRILTGDRIYVQYYSSISTQTGQRHVTRQEVWGGNKEPVKGSNENLGLSSDTTICRRCFEYFFSLSVYDSLTQCTVSSLFLSKSISVCRTDPSFMRSSSRVPYSSPFFPSFVTITSMRMKFQWSSWWCLFWIIQFFSASCIRSSFKFALFALNDYCLNIVSLLTTEKKDRQYKNQEERYTRGKQSLVILSLRRCLTVTEKLYFVCLLLQSLLLPFYDYGNRY